MTNNNPSLSINIIGAGVFGAAAALELARRGHHVRLFDPGPIPHPHASSTDISKAIRMDYGADAYYMSLMEAAIEGWTRWNAAWEEALYHPVGVNILSREPMAPGGFEHDSYALLLERGYKPHRLGADVLRAHAPAFDAAHYPDGYYNPVGGWAESGRVVAKLTHLAKDAGVSLHEGTKFKKLVETEGRVTGFETASGEVFSSDYVVISAGAWTPQMLPELQNRMWSVAQPVFHFKVKDLRLFQPPLFTVWTGDVARTGWYGFPAKDDGTLKIANHGAGWMISPDGPREMPAVAEEKFRAFLRDSFPSIADAPVVGERLCFYCDTWDGDLWIDHDPAREGLVVAAGGSGHGFKFAPMLGGIIADTVERKPNPFQHRFAWRTPGERRTEDARFLG